jgi:hypothetical protein
MATWIVHLRLAENLLDLINGLSPDYFAIGNISPDSGMPDEKWENFNPPPEITHFQAREGEHWRIADLEFYRCYLIPAQEESVSRQQVSFLLGYFFHLVTDNLWEHLVARPTMERFAAQFTADPEFVWEVKRDWYGLDFEHVRTHPDSLFWRVFLKCQYDHDYIDFLPVEAIQTRIDYIKHFYQRTDEKLEAWYGRRPDKYLSQEEMEMFIETANEKLYRIYNYLQQSRHEVLNYSSALALAIEPLG